MSIRSELLSIQHACPDGVLHASDVVAWAKENAESALHSAIEWNNKKAADAHRLWQVRQLIQLHVVTEDGAPQLVSLSIDRKVGGGYRSVSDVVEKPDLRAILLQDALDELERVQAKYQRVEALATVWQEAETVRARSGSRRRSKTKELVSA